MNKNSQLEKLGPVTHYPFELSVLVSTKIASHIHQQGENASRKEIYDSRAFLSTEQVFESKPVKNGSKAKDASQARVKVDHK